MFCSPLEPQQFVNYFNEFIVLKNETHFQVFWDQDLSGLLDHWLWFELLFAEGVPYGIEVRLARGVGEIFRLIHVKHTDHVRPVARRCQQRWTGGRGGGTR